MDLGLQKKKAPLDLKNSRKESFIKSSLSEVDYNLHIRAPGAVLSFAEIG